MVTCPSCGQENPEGARFCMACASPLGVQAAERREERKVVTVLFCDLVGFTARAENLDPEDVGALLSPYHARLRAELERFGGTVEKFIGDAVMALFGAPVAHEDDAERAVRAALAIRDWITEDGENLQVRIAVNTGEALVNLGARPEAGEGMASGDVVNTTSRLQAAAPVNGILVAEGTYRATDAAVEYEPRDAVEVKGKAEPIRVWEALQARSRLGADVVDEARGPLVGRDRELALLRETLARVREERSAQLVTLVGVPGIGKSRLLAELLQVADADSELITWRQGRCLPYGDGVTFWALGEVVKAHAGILETDAEVDVDEKLRSTVAALVEDDQEARWVAEALRPLAGLRGEAGGDEAAAAWRRFLEAVAESGPFVLVLEDLHWADDGLLDFVDDLVGWLRGVPLLLVGTARPELLEHRPGWGGGKANATTISLAPLGDEETSRLISSLLGRAVQLAEDRQALLERAGGNPLYAEQYVRMLVERGSEEAGLELPQSVHGIIAARLDALSAPEKELLQDAAVFGKVFWLGAAAAGAGIDRRDAEQQLRRLEHKEFIRRDRRSAVAGDTQYAFEHVLLRDVAYGQIPRRRRAGKHRRAAEWIEALGRSEDHAETLAHHYKQALELRRAAGIESDPDLEQRARQALRRAGDRALSLYAYAPAAEFFEAALALWPAGDPERPRLLLEHARALFAIGGAGLELLTDALEAFRAAGDVEGAAEAATMAAAFAWHGGDRAATDCYIGLALELVEGLPPSRAKAEALVNQSGYFMLGGEFDASIRVGSQALPLVEQLGMESERARLHIVIGCARCCLGDAAGVQEIQSAIQIAESAGALSVVVLGHGNLASELAFFGRLAESRRESDRWRELIERYGFTRHRRSATADAAGWAFADGRWDEAMGVLGELIGAADAGERDYTDALALSQRAWIRLARGDAAGAAADSERAAALARDSDAQAQSQSFCVRAAVALETGLRAEADDLASELAAIGTVLMPALNAPFPTFAEVAWVFRDLGRDDELSVVAKATPIESPWRDAALAIAAGDPVRAAELIAAMGHAASAGYTRLRAAEELARAGRPAEADAQAAQALAFYREAGAPAYARRAGALLTASASGA